MIDAPTPRRRLTLGWPIFLVWCLLYLGLMAHGDWPWQGAGILGFGMPRRASLQDFGAAVPTLIRDGEWWRLFLSAWLHHSLLGLLLLGWWWTSAARTLVSIGGMARTWIVFLLGGVGGALAHTFAHPESSMVGGAGPFDAIAAGIGAQLVWGFGSKRPEAPRVRNGAIVSIVIVGALTWYFTRGATSDPSVRALAGFEAMLGGLGTGMLLMLGFGPRRIDRPAGKLTRFAAILLGVILAAAAIEQAPRLAASSQRGDVKAFLATLQRAEAKAVANYRKGGGSVGDQNELHRRLERVLASEFLEGYEGADAARTYVEAMRAWTEPQRLPYVPHAACRKAFRAWYDTYEEPLRSSVGIRKRYDTEQYWERD